MISSPNDVTIFFRKGTDSITTKEYIKKCADVFARKHDLSSCGRLYYRPCKKPRFIGKKGVYISVSHSGKYILVAFAFAPIGIDIELKSKHDTARIAKRFYHAEEYLYAQSTDFASFFDIWTAKESYVKLTGQGIGNGFEDFSVIQDGHFGTIDDNTFTFPSFDSDYVLCICIRNPGEISFTEF